MSMDARPRGVIPILCTPFADDESIDPTALGREIDHLLGLDIQGVGIGYGSEIPRLAEGEREELLAMVVERVAGRLPVMVAVGGGSRVAALAMARRMAAGGASLLMVTPPTGGAISAEAMVSYFGAIGEVGVPIVLQDAPGSTGVQMPVGALAGIVGGVEAVVALKVETQDSAVKIGRLARELDGAATVLGGAGGRDFLRELDRGADGTVPGPALVEIFARVWRAHERGDRGAARREFAQLHSLLGLFARTPDSFFLVQKEVLRMQGVFESSRLRWPSEDLDPLLPGEIGDALAEVTTPG